MLDGVRHMAAALRGLVGHPAFRASPGRVMVRGIAWAGHCAAGRPATIPLGSHGGRLRLPPRLLRGGAGGVFILRDAYEPELRWFEQILRPGMVVVDGGANLGIFSMLASRAVGDGGRVLAFEPGETARASLARNVALNAAGNVTVVGRALSDTSGTARLYHTRGGLVGYSIYRDELGADGYEEIETTTIDETLDSLGLDRLDVIKLDVEGAEAPALRGAMRAIERTRPTILFEMQPHAPIAERESHADAWRVLADAGYSLWHLDEHGELVAASEPRVGNNIARAL